MSENDVIGLLINSYNMSYEQAKNIYEYSDKL